MATDALVDRIRLRYRLRAGLLINMKDNLEVGFSLGTDDAASAANSTGGKPTSNNTTFTGNGTKKFIFVDTAYGKWTPINDGDWMLSGTFGKMDQPFDASSMVFDPDYTPEGGAIQAATNSTTTIRFDSTARHLCWMKCQRFNAAIRFMYGGQVILECQMDVASCQFAGRFGV